jgi:hypothetical protein
MSWRTVLAATIGTLILFTWVSTIPTQTQATPAIMEADESPPSPETAADSPVFHSGVPPEMEGDPIIAQAQQLWNEPKSPQLKDYEDKITPIAREAGNMDALFGCNIRDPNDAVEKLKEIYVKRFEPSVQRAWGKLTIPEQNKGYEFEMTIRLYSTKFMVVSYTEENCAKLARSPIGYMDY